MCLQRVALLALLALVPRAAPAADPPARAVDAGKTVEAPGRWLPEVQQDRSGHGSLPPRTLDIGAWSQPFELADHDTDTGLPGITVRLRPATTVLEFDLTMDHFEVTRHPPWQNGSGVLVAVVQPDVHGKDGGSYFTEFAFGMYRGQVPLGAVRRAGRWQPMAELAPVFSPDEASERLRMSFAIPWSICGGLHPLVDATLGLNITYVQRGARLPHGRAALLADPAAGLAGGRADDRTGALADDRAAARWRRAMPFDWRWSPVAGPAVHGRIADLLVRQPYLALNPLAVLATTGDSTAVRLVARDRRGVIRLQTNWSLGGPAGRRARQGRLPVDLPAGSALLGASYLDPASGTIATWQTDLVSLPQGWEDAVAGRMPSLPARERPSLQHRLDAVVAEMRSRQPMDSPSALGSMINEIEAMLDRFASAGTTVPDGGSYLAVMPGRNGAPDLPVSLSLPDGWRRGHPARVLLLMLRATGGQMQAATQAPQFLAGLAGRMDAPAPDAVMAIPHLGDRDDQTCDAACVAHVMDWLRDFLACGPIHLAGIDLLAAAALEAASVRRDDLAGVLMVTGMNFTPHPQDDDAALAARVMGLGLDPQLPVGWIWFPEEQQPGDQAAVLRRGLRAAGLRLKPSSAVQGALTFDQAWQRALQWTVQPAP